MMETRLIGLVGGLGPAATVHYYQRLLATCDQRGWVARVVITRADVRRVLAAAADGDLKGMAVHLASKLAELDRTGAEVRAIGAVTPHMCMPELAQLTRSPLLDPIDVLNEELTRTGIERVALMGARATGSWAGCSAGSEPASWTPRRTSWTASMTLTSPSCGPARSDPTLPRRSEGSHGR